MPVLTVAPSWAERTTCAGDRGASRVLDADREVGRGHREVDDGGALLDGQAGQRLGVGQLGEAPDCLEHAPVGPEDDELHDDRLALRGNRDVPVVLDVPLLGHFVAPDFRVFAVHLVPGAGRKRCFGAAQDEADRVRSRFGEDDVAGVGP